MWCWLLASCSHHASCLLLCLWCGKVPGGILGTLPHGTHQPREAHVLGFLQPTHQPLLHDGYELLITELPVPWSTDRRVEEKIEGRQPVERWCNNRHGISKTFFPPPIDDFRLSESDSYVPSQSNRANTTSHTWSDSSTLATVRATCFMVTERRKEGGTDREIHHLWDGEIEVQVTQSSS